MKVVKYLLVLSIVFTSCKTKKYAMSTNAIAKEMSAKKVARKHVAANFNKETVDAKLKADFNDGKTKQSITVYLKIKKDEVIWLKGTKFINVFKAKITPNSFQFYSPLERKFFKGDFTMLKNLLGVDINFQQLQNLFLGQSVLDVKKEKQKVTIINNAYVLSPEIQSVLFDAFFNVNPGHFKLDSQSIINPLKNQRLDIKYPSYTFTDDEVFPREINISAKDGTKLTTIDFTLKAIEFNTELDTSFSIPNGYKRINL